MQQNGAVDNVSPPCAVGVSGRRQMHQSGPSGHAVIGASQNETTRLVRVGGCEQNDNVIGAPKNMIGHC